MLVLTDFCFPDVAYCSAMFAIDSSGARVSYNTPCGRDRCPSNWGHSGPVHVRNHSCSFYPAFLSYFILFSTISAAMASLSGTAPATVFIFPGTYTEQVVIAHPNLTIMGSTTESVIISEVLTDPQLYLLPKSTGSYKQNTVTITNNLNAQDAGSGMCCCTSFFKDSLIMLFR
jgi:pectin methylesterase-like acyl-CoA thioesterase